MYKDNLFQYTNRDMALHYKEAGKIAKKHAIAIMQLSRKYGIDCKVMLQYHLLNSLLTEETRPYFKKGYMNRKIMAPVKEIFNKCNPFEVRDGYRNYKICPEKIMEFGYVNSDHQWVINTCIYEREPLINASINKREVVNDAFFTMDNLSWDIFNAADSIGLEPFALEQDVVTLIIKYVYCCDYDSDNNLVDLRDSSTIKRERSYTNYMVRKIGESKYEICNEVRGNFALRDMLTKTDYTVGGFNEQQQENARKRAAAKMVM